MDDKKQNKQTKKLDHVQPQGEYTFLGLRVQKLQFMASCLHQFYVWFETFLRIPLLKGMVEQRCLPICSHVEGKREKGEGRGLQDTWFHSIPVTYFLHEDKIPNLPPPQISPPAENWAFTIAHIQSIIPHSSLKIDQTDNWKNLFSYLKFDIFLFFSIMQGLDWTSMVFTVFDI